jgi:hypothetical protein
VIERQRAGDVQRVSPLDGSPRPGPHGASPSTPTAAASSMSHPRSCTTPNRRRPHRRQGPPRQPRYQPQRVEEAPKLAATLVTCRGDACHKASDRTRKQFNAVLFSGLDVKEGRTCHEEYRLAFDDIGETISVKCPSSNTGHECPQRDSNPCYRLERAAS